MANARTLTAAILYWDTSDSADCGWAWRATYDDGHEESGPVMSGLDDGAGISDVLFASDLTPGPAAEPSEWSEVQGGTGWEWRAA